MNFALELHEKLEVYFFVFRIETMFLKFSSETSSASTTSTWSQDSEL